MEDDFRHPDAELGLLGWVVSSSDDAIITKDLNGVITSWNGGAQSIFGWSPQEAIGRPITILIPEDRIDEEPDILDRIRLGEKVDHYETVRCRKDGSALEISLTVSPIVDSTGRIIGASKIARDITDRKAAESARRELDIMDRLVEAQESERNRIARDLHDNIGQKMTGLRLKVDSILSRWSGQTEAAHEFVEIQESLAELDRDISFLSWELRPTELENVGLSDALGSFASEWSRQYGINVEYHTELGLEDRNAARFSARMETNLYRITQEALNNVLKHASASSVNILLHFRGGKIGLVIEDDGVGFDPRLAEVPPEGDHRGFGLRSMRERMELMKGTLEIESRPGKGTTIIARAPVARVLIGAA